MDCCGDVICWVLMWCLIRWFFFFFCDLMVDLAMVVWVVDLAFWIDVVWVVDRDFRSVGLGL